MHPAYRTSRTLKYRRYRVSLTSYNIHVDVSRTTVRIGDRGEGREKERRRGEERKREGGEREKME